jgi:hypothetical protein
MSITAQVCDYFKEWTIISRIYLQNTFSYFYLLQLRVHNQIVIRLKTELFDLPIVMAHLLQKQA